MATATTSAKATNGKEPAATVEDIGDQLDKLSADIAALTKTVADFGSAKADSTLRQASMMKDSVSEKTAAMATDARDRLVSAESDFEDRIRANPLAAVGIAAGVGFLFAVFTRR